MKQTHSAAPHFAICVNNTDYPASLELHKVYRLLPDDDAQHDGDLRVIHESGEDYLFPAKCFLVVEFPATVQRALRSSFRRGTSAAHA